MRPARQPRAGAWSPILHGDLRDRALEAVAEAAAAVVRPHPAWIPEPDAEPFRVVRGVSLASGSSGVAVFLAQLAAAPPRTGGLEGLRRMVAHAESGLAAVEFPTGFMAGAVGALWALHHVSVLTGIEPDGLGTTLAGVDADLVDHPVVPAGHDLWSGIVGHGVYALARPASPEARWLAADVCGRLVRWHELSWPQSPWMTTADMLRPRARGSAPRGFTSLGAAHGVAGAVGFLARALAAGAADEHAAVVCDRSWQWLCAQEDSDSMGGFLPNKVLPDEEPHRGQEFWCNGLPGLAGVLVAAARRLGHEDMRAWALERIRPYAMAAASIAAPEAGLCHGAAGLGHIFNRLAQETGDEVFAEAARHQFVRALDLRREGRGVAGWIARGYDRDDELCDLYEPGLMQGAAGVGLALHAAATDREPAWDSALLLS